MAKASIVPRDFLGIRMHISNVYFSGTGVVALSKDVLEFKVSRLA